MEGSKYRKTGFLLALGSAALFGFGANSARAEFLLGAASSEETVHTTGNEFVPYGSAPYSKVSYGREDGQAVLRGLRHEWESLRREVATAAVTMFFIRGGTPPSTPPSDPGSNTTPPGQSNTPPGGQGEPPPPGGQGDTPPGDPGNPPNGTPEPASLLLALLGAGVAVGFRWRQTRRS